MADLTITHTHADGTLIDGTTKGDGTNTILKSVGFRWFRTLGTWGIPHSRDRQPNTHIIDRARAALDKASVQPLVIDVDDPEYTGPGERLGRIEYEEFLAQGNPDFVLEYPQDEWEAISLNYTSGTTGKPKGIMHGHGGVVLEHLKAVALQSDIGAEDTFFWFTSPSWMMWNFQVAGLLVEAIRDTVDALLKDDQARPLNITMTPTMMSV